MTYHSQPLCLVIMLYYVCSLHNYLFSILMYMYVSVLIHNKLLKLGSHTNDIKQILFELKLTTLKPFRHEGQIATTQEKNTHTHYCVICYDLLCFVPFLDLEDRAGLYTYIYPQCKHLIYLLWCIRSSRN